VRNRDLLRRPYLLGAAAALAIVALVVLIVVLLGTGDDGTPAAVDTPTATATAPASASPGTTPSPTQALTPTATLTPATSVPTATPTPPPATGVLIEHGDRRSQSIALTFDMGGRVDPALEIMQWLIGNNVHATIFMTGAMAENQNTEAGRQVLRIVEANPGLFDLGNHSYSHPDFRDLTAQEMAGVIQRTDAAIARYVSVSPRPFFRPPLGGQDADVVAGVAAAGYPYTVMWDVDTIDWRPESEGGPTTTSIVAKVVAVLR
jgi:peptidoglycan/xylan/chitin deacetylase (PgdA/CDA1 family)